MVHHHARHLHKKIQNKDPFNYAVYFFMVATPLFEVPQAYAIYNNRSAESVSPYTWGFFFVATLVWLVYAIKHRLKPLIFMYTLYVLTEGTIVAGIIMYS